MAALFDTGIFSVLTSAGAIDVGATLTWYRAGSTTPVITFADADATIPNLNPVTADANGRFPQIWLLSGTYKYVLKSSAGVTLKTVDELAINDVNDPSTREIWLDSYYEDEDSTDTEAVLAFAAEFSSGRLGEVTLRYPSKGRGPSGRFLVEQEIEFTGGLRLIIDFGTATVRYTTPASKFKYTGGPGSTSSAVTPTDFFVVRGGVHQYAAAVDCVFFWNMTYRPSRIMGTGYAEGVRIIPQSGIDASMTTAAHFRTKNTWYFSVFNSHCTGPPRNVGSIVAGNCMIEQQGVCIVTTIDQATEGIYFDRVIKAGWGAMVGVEATFNSGTYARAKALRQGANIAYFGRNDGAYGYTYSLYDESGALTAGAADLLDSTGVVVGSVTINSIGRYFQPSEGFQVKGASTFVNGNYFFNEAAQTNPDSSAQPVMLNVGFHDMHCAFYQGFCKLDGVADFQVGTGIFLIALEAGLQAIDINHGQYVDVDRVAFTTNGLGGKFFKGRNIDVGRLTGNKTFFCETVWDLDNTVKTFNIEGNVAADDVGTTFANISTAKRYNSTNTRGVRFRNNGLMGIGFDQDSLRERTYTPVVTSGSGAIGSYTITNCVYKLGDGLFVLNLKLRIVTRGTAAGAMFVTLPVVNDSQGVPIAYTKTFGAMVNVRVGAAIGIAAMTDTQIAVSEGDVGNTFGTGNAFKVRDSDIPGNTDYFFQTVIPVEYD